MAVCLHCGQEFAQKRKDQLFCCKEHRWRYNASLQHERRKTGEQATKRAERQKELEARDKEICDLRLAGESFEDIAKRFDLAQCTVIAICQKHDIDKQIREKRNLEIVELRKQGYSMTQIAEMYGLVDVWNICKQYGVDGVMSDRKATYTERSNPFAKRTEEDKREIVERYLADGFSYVGGYTGIDGFVTIKCNVCGNEFERSMTSIRHPDRTTLCPFCVENDLQEKQRKKQQEKKAREFDRQQKKAQRQRDKEAELFSKTKMVECAECGNIFTTADSRRVFCSNECLKNYYRKYYTKRKDKRIPESRRIDKGITVKKLYKRDKGICWICGKKCDLNDFITTDSAIICGDNYPSVDHVVPVSEGGLDAWSNVRLAHRRCNYMRYWEESSRSRVANG